MQLMVYTRVAEYHMDLQLYQKDRLWCVEMQHFVGRPEAVILSVAENLGGRGAEPPLFQNP